MNNHSNFSIPPLIIMRREDAFACVINRGIKSWFTSKAIRNANAFVIYDPCGSLWNKYGVFFKSKNYALKRLDLSDIKSSAKYNPLAYVNDDLSAKKLAAALIDGTRGMGKLGDIGFIAHEIMLLNTLINYIHREAPDYEKNIQMLIKILEHMIIEDYQEGYVSAVDILFEDLGINEPHHTSVALYYEFKEAVYDSEHAMRIAESCLVRLAPFNTPDMIDFMSSDGLHLNRLTIPGNTALFVTGGESEEIAVDSKFLVPLMYSQLYDTLYQKRV